MIKYLRYFVVGVVAFVFASPFAFAGEEGKDIGKEVTITGRVVDPACYTHMGLKGESHKECAVLCQKAGQAFGILDEKNDVLYQVIEASPGTDPNKLIASNVEQIIVLKGKVYEKSGIKTIIPTEVVQVKGF